MGSPTARPDPVGRNVPERARFVCLSPQEWGVDLPTNRQQIMARVAARGNEVLFVETGPWAGRYLRALVRGRGRRTLLHQLTRGELVAPLVRVIKAPTLLPWGHKYRGAARVNAALTARTIRRHLRGSPGPVVLWLYDPCFADCIGRSGERLAVYDCVDDYAEQTGGDERKHRLVTVYDALAASRADLVFATATPLFERHRRLNPRTHLVRNVGDYTHFSPAAAQDDVAPSVAGLQHPVLGFAGNFASSKVDFELLGELADHRPEWTLLLVGPTEPDVRARLEAIERRPNVHVAGGKPYDELPSYVAAFDVALIPYVANAYTRSCFPLKTFEYLAAGKPVVATGLPELAGMEPHVALTAGLRATVEAVEDALARRSPADVEARQTVAAQHTWETRTARLLALVTETLDGTGAGLPGSEVATTLSR